MSNIDENVKEIPAEELDDNIADMEATSFFEEAKILAYMDPWKYEQRDRIYNERYPL